MAQMNSVSVSQFNHIESWINNSKFIFTEGNTVFSLITELAYMWRYIRLKTACTKLVIY